MQNKLVAFLQCSGIVLKVILLARISHLRLIKRYPIATVCLSFSLFRTSTLVYFSQTGNPRSGWLFYAVTQPILWVLYFLLMLEFFSLVLEDFPGIRRLVRVVVFAGLAVASLVCCVLIMLEQRSGSIREPLLAFLIAQDRSIFLCLSALTAIFFLFVAYYRLTISRNLWVLSASFSGYFILSSALSALFRYFGDGFAFTRNLVNSLSYLTALLCASLLLSRAGETQDDKFPVPWTGGNQELELALMAQLQSFNHVLRRVLKPW